jgi:hypothetical protein
MMKKGLFVLASLLVMSSFASAAFSYGNAVGTSVTYNTITADSDLWGNMTVNGDALWFFPTDFQLESENGAPDYTHDPVNGDFNLDNTLQFELAVKPGQAENRVIDSISFLEYGDYGLIDNIGGAGTDTTFAAVTGTIFINILEVNGAPAPFMPPINATMTFTPSDGDYYLDADGETLQTWWNGGADISLAGFNATKVQVSIDNQLSVMSEDGTIARIEKKGFGENPAVSVSPVIPEPATLALLGLGGLMLRRKK